MNRTKQLLLLGTVLSTGLLLEVPANLGDRAGPAGQMPVGEVERVLQAQLGIELRLRGAVLGGVLLVGHAAASPVPVARPRSRL